MFFQHTKGGQECKFLTQTLLFFRQIQKYLDTFWKIHKYQVSVNSTLETYGWFGSAEFAKPCLRYLTSVGFTRAPPPGAPLFNSLCIFNATALFYHFFYTEEKEIRFDKLD